MPIGHKQHYYLQGHAKLRGQVLRDGERIMPLMQCRHGHCVIKQHCCTAFDVCGRVSGVKMSQGVEKCLPFKAYENMHIRLLRAQPDSVANHVTDCSISD